MKDHVVLFNIHRSVLMEVLEVIVPLFLLPVLKYTYPDLTLFNFSNFKIACYAKIFVLFNGSILLHWFFGMPKKY